MFGHPILSSIRAPEKSRMAEHALHGETIQSPVHSAPRPFRHPIFLGLPQPADHMTVGALRRPMQQAMWHVKQPDVNEFIPLYITEYRTLPAEYLRI